MRLFPNVSIKRKQMWIIMLTCSAALLLACAAFVSYEMFTFRSEMKRNLLSLSSRISEKTSGCLTFADKQCGKENLKIILDDEPNVVLACLYNKEGRLFAEYRRSDQTEYFTPPPAPQKAGFHFALDRLTLARQVVVDDVIGSIYIESDLQAMYSRLLRYAGIVASVLLLASVLAFILSSRLQRIISDPIIHLAQVAKIVSQKKNYAIRAEKQTSADGTNDEIHALIDGFNEMLAEIQVRDAELQKAREQLEKRVAERTRDLQQEVSERTRTETLLQQQFARISLLNQITHSIAERMDLNSVLNIVLKQLKDHLPTDFGAVFVVNPAGNFVLSASTELANAQARKAAVLTVVPPAQSGFADCLKGRTVSVADLCDVNFSYLKSFAPATLRSIVAAPLIVEEKPFGVLVVARSQPNSFSEGETQFLETLCRHVALAAHQARLHTELQGAYDELRQTQNAVMQQQRLRALGEMASGIAHDINNALSPVIVYSELLLRNERYLAESSKKHLNNIKTAGEDIAHIVARMREFYRRREENEQLIPINLNLLTEQVIELTRPRWRDIPQQKGIVIEMATDLDPYAPDIQGNASELREALTNLILNAVDAMPTGGKLMVRTRATFSPDTKDKTPTHVALEVTDTGIGMDEETRNRCLEPFFSTKGQRGTGLGLAMVYGIMERHEGTIEIDSEVSKGTTMRLVFPIREATAYIHDNTKDKPLQIPPLRILCVDDEPLLRQLMKEILESDGHNVSVADGGQAGIETFRTCRANNDHFDVVITDLGMPYVDGKQVACVLKKECPKTPVILLTGWGTMMKADGELPSQVDAVISKPPRISELRETLLKVSCRAGNQGS